MHRVLFFPLFPKFPLFPTLILHPPIFAISKLYKLSNFTNFETQLNPLIIIAIAAGLWYIPTLLTVLKLEVSFKSIVPTRILENSIDFQLGLNIKNNGANIRINTLDVDVYFNNLKIGHLFNSINTNISARTDKVIYSNFSITPDNLGIDTWRDVISIDLHNSVIRLSGKLTANGRPFPFSTDYTIKEVFENLDIIKQ